MPIEVNRAAAELSEFYEIYRCAALNKEYYGRLLARYQKYNSIMEIVIALGATSSGISGLAILNGAEWGRYVWGVITLFSAAFAIAKPILQFNKKIERYSRLFTGHLDNYIALNSLIAHIRRKRHLTEDIIKQLERAEQRYAELSRSDDPVTNKVIREQCEATVKSEIPDTVLWHPKLNSPNIMPIRGPSSVQEQK